MYGEVLSYNKNKGHVKVKLSGSLSVGDGIDINGNTCIVSEIENDVIGRIKGDIFPGNKIYKTINAKLNKENKIQTNANIRKVDVYCRMYKDNNLLILEIYDDTNTSAQAKIELDQYISGYISKQRIIEQLLKTGSTQYYFKYIQIDVDEEIRLPISMINNLRREAVALYEKEVLKRINRKSSVDFKYNKPINRINNKEKTLSLLLNHIDNNLQYMDLDYTIIDNIYVPLREFIKHKEFNFNNKPIYVYMPIIIDKTYEILIKNNLELFKKVEGVVISHISQIKLLKKYNITKKIIANYSLNITNDISVGELEKLNITKYVLSPEINKDNINSLSNKIKKEIIVYGRTLLMVSKHCFIGNNRKKCDGLCYNKGYYLSDRLNYNFPVLGDTINCHSYIYNSKITSVSYIDCDVDSIRVDILDENIEEINKIMNLHKNGNRLTGNSYTNGNVNENI